VIDGQLEQIKGVSYSLLGFTGPHVHSLLDHSYTVDRQFEDLGGTDVNWAVYQHLGGNGTDMDWTGLLKYRGSRLYQCVIYLSPGEYHHFHSPADWLVTGRRHFPGV